MCLAVIVLWDAVASAQAPDAGPQVFATRCASCHGTTGNGGELGPARGSRRAHGCGALELSASQVWKASPMTYFFDNQQHVAVASGPNIMSFGLPTP